MHALFPTDFLLDLTMLIVVQLAFGNLHIPRLLAGEAILFTCTLLLLASGMKTPLSFAVHIPVFLISAAVAAGEKRPARILEAGACMFCASAAAAGFVSMSGALLPALCGAALLLFLLRGRRHALRCWNIELYVERNGLSASFPALIDTGNRLREHRSGLPVLIVEEGAMPALIPLLRSLPPGQVRTLPFGVLGSSGEVSCFRADRVDIVLPFRGRIRAPDCWVAAFPGRIPGRIRALAPPEFADAPQAPLPVFHRRFKFR